MKLEQNTVEYSTEYCLSNISELRELGTTNFFRYLKDKQGKVDGVLNILRTFPVTDVNQAAKAIRHYLLFSLVDEDEDNLPQVLPTVTTLLNNVKIADIKRDIVVLKELVECFPVIRAETQLSDYRNNLNPTMFRVTYLTSETLFMNNIKPYKEINETYKEKDAADQTPTPISTTNKEVEIPSFLLKNKQTKGKIRGF